MNVSLYLRVRFSECDAQNVVFNARYADYVDVASTEYMRYLVGGYQRLVERGFSTQVVNLNIDWFAPAVFDEVLLLTMSCANIGTSSFSLTCSIKRLSDHTKIAKASVVYCVLDDVKAVKTVIPEDIRTSLVNDVYVGPLNFAGDLPATSTKIPV
jgi:acyl-CoA thioester hydrolase